MQQGEFLKNMRESLSGVQAKANARLEALEGDARKALNELVEKGKVSQKDIQERLSKLAQAEVIQQRVKPLADELKKVAQGESLVKLADLTKRVKEAREKATHFVDTASRDQALALATELRKFAERLEQLAKRAETAAAEATGAETTTEAAEVH